LPYQQRTRETLEDIARTLTAGCRKNPRRKRPNTDQLLLGRQNERQIQKPTCWMVYYRQSSGE
jgi:hypothetical protein